jgi:UDP-N-acetylmuramate dehydrogenase
VRLSDYTTLRLGGPARRFVRAGTEEDLVQAVRAADSGGEPTLILGGGSNLVVADEGFDGTVIQVATKGVEPGGGPGLVTVAAGEDWDAVVAWTVAAGLAGLECLSGIPGLAGATPIQNVGAYGQEVAKTITSVRTYDRVTGQISIIPNERCGFGYRTSVFKRDDARRHVVLSVTFRLAAQPVSAPVRYAELAGVEAAARVRCGAGTRVPRFAAGDGLVKVPAAWLIERAGFGKGYSPGDGARISSKHTLALVTCGSATTAGLLTLAREIRDGVHDAFGVSLTPEPVLVGVTL